MKGHLLSHTTDSGEHWPPRRGMRQPDQDVLGPCLLSEATLRKAWELRGLQEWGQERQQSGLWLPARGRVGLFTTSHPVCSSPSSSSHSTSPPRKPPHLSSSASVSVSLSPSSSLSVCFLNLVYFTFQMPLQSTSSLPPPWCRAALRACVQWPQHLFLLLQPQLMPSMPLFLNPGHK